MTIPTAPGTPHTNPPFSLGRSLQQLPQELRRNIFAFKGPTFPESLSKDLFEPQPVGTPEDPASRPLKLNFLKDSLTPENSLKLLKQSMLHSESDFITLLKPVYRGRQPAPFLAPLIEVATLNHLPNALDKLIDTVVRTNTPLPESTYTWVADCGQPQILNKLLAKTPHNLSTERQQALRDVATTQETERTELTGRPLEERQARLLELASNPRIRNTRTCLALLQTPDIDINAADSRGHTALHGAIASGNTDIANALLQAPGINVNVAESNCQTPLHYAISAWNTDIANALLQTPSIDVNAAESNGQTPLHYAVGEGNMDIINALLRTPGINVNAIKRDGQTPLHYAINRGNLDIVNALRRAGALAHPDRTISVGELAQRRHNRQQVAGYFDRP